MPLKGGREKPKASERRMIEMINIWRKRNFVLGGSALIITLANVITITNNIVHRPSPERLLAERLNYCGPRLIAGDPPPSDCTPDEIARAAADAAAYHQKLDEAICEFPINPAERKVQERSLNPCPGWQLDIGQQKWEEQQRHDQFTKRPLKKGESRF